MENILQINSSIHEGDGQSSRLADEFVANLRRQQAKSQLKVRNLASDPVPHLDAERFAAFLSKPEDRNPDQQAVVAYSDGLISELKQADTIVIGLPMYNFGVPSQLKAWIDHVARAGVTFRYTEQGPIGLLTGKKAYVLATRGGMYAGTPADTQTNYLRDFLAFIGITDVEFVYAEGLAMGDVAKTEALSSAKNTIRKLTFAHGLAA
jgi:FMN-dependent NADH-azoreductase